MTYEEFFLKNTITAIEKWKSFYIGNNPQEKVFEHNRLSFITDLLEKNSIPFLCDYHYQVTKKPYLIALFDDGFYSAVIELGETEKKRVYQWQVYGFFRCEPGIIVEKIAEKVELEQAIAKYIEDLLKLQYQFKTSSPNDETNYAVVYYSKDTGWHFEDGWSKETAIKIKNEKTKEKDVTLAMVVAIEE